MDWRRKIIRLCFCLPLLLCCSSLSLQQERVEGIADWPQWGRDARRSGSTPVSLSWPLELKWRYRTSALAMPSLIALQDLLLVSSMDGKQESLRLQDAKSVGSIRLRGGIPFSLAVSGQKLVVMRKLERNNLLCHDLQSGKIDWRRSIGACLGEPLLFKDRIYVALQRGRLACYLLQNGQELYAKELTSQINTSLCLSDSCLIAVNSSGQVQAFTAELKPLWSFNCNGPVAASPVCDQHAVYLGTISGELLAISLDQGREKWRIPVHSAIYQSAAVTDSMVVFGCSDYTVYGIAAGSGEIKWRFSTAGPISTTPLICGETAVIGSMDRTLYAIDLHSGQQKWSYTATGRWRGSPIISRNRLLCAAENDLLYCFGSP